MTPDPQNPLDDEIEAALAETNLQEVDLPERRGRAGGSGPAADSGGVGAAKGQSDERLMSGTIVEVRGDDVFVELGPRMQGFVPGAEFEELPKVGEDFEVVTIATGRNSVAGIRAFFADEDVQVDNLPLFLDPKQKLARDMAVLGLPITLILNPEGQEIARMRGDAEWNSDSAKAIIQALIAQSES